MREIFTVNPVPVLLFFLVLLVFIIFFYRAIKHTGLEKLMMFTIIMLGIFTGIMLLDIVGVNFMELVPVQVMWSLPQFLDLAVFIGLPVFFIISIIKIRKKKSVRFLTAVWLIIVLFNIVDLVWHISFLFFINDIPGDIKIPFTERLAIASYLFQPLVLLPMIYPFCWVIVSSISLFKIRKENRRSLAVQTVS